MDFDRDMKKLCILIAAVILLEIPVFFVWKYFSGDKQETPPAEIQISATEETTLPHSTEPVLETTVVPTEAVTVPEETAAPETKPQETIPEETLPAETIPEETVPETTVPEETVPAESMPEEPVPINWDQVPQYYQDHYPDARYGRSTMTHNGGSMTALAMVASYMTETEYLPDQMADWLAHFLGGDYQRLEYGSDLLGLVWKRGLNVYETLQGVQDGKIAILLIGSNSIFGNDRYLVVTGVNEDGTYRVMDTHSTHFGTSWLNQFFENGFTTDQLRGGYQAGWIYDKNAMPENYKPYQPEPPAAECRYGDLELSDYDINLLVRLICMEAGSEPFDGQQAVAEVVLNRLHSGKFQNSVYNIIHAPEQFPSADRLHLAEPTYSQYKAVEQALNGPYVLPDDVHFFAKFKVNDKLWGKIGSHYFCYSY